MYNINKVSNIISSKKGITMRVFSGFVFVVLFALLAACTTTAPTPTTPTITIVEGNKTVNPSDDPITFTASLQNSTEAITWLLNGGNGSISTTSGESTIYTPPSSSNGGTDTLTATAGSATNSVTITINAPSNSIDSVTIESFDGSKQVRQGAQNIKIEVMGTKLGGTSIAKLGDISATSVNAADSIVQLEFDIPYDAPVGQQTLTLFPTAGEVNKSNAVEITAITVDATNGDDSTDAKQGTTDNPYKTLKYAIDNYTQSGSTVKLLDGTHSVSSTITLPEDLTIEGSSKTGTILQGNGNDGFYFNGDASISNLEMTSFASAMTQIDNNDVVNLSNISVRNNSTGLWASGSAEVIANDSSFNNNSSDGIELYGGVTFSMTGGEASNNNSDGIYVNTSETASVSLSNNIMINSNGNAGLNITSSGEIKVTLDNLTVTNNSDGLYFSASFGDLELKNSSFDGNSDDGVDINSIRDATVDNVSIDNSGDHGFEFSATNGNLNSLRNTTISNSASYGMYVSNGPTTFDLGTTANPGNNTFKNNGNYQLYDTRNSNDDVVIQAVGVILGNKVGTGTLRTGTDFEDDGNIKMWRINNSGYKIRFSDPN